MAIFAISNRHSLVYSYYSAKLSVIYSVYPTFAVLVHGIPTEKHHSHSSGQSPF
jgi:hypothetical protein